MHPIPVVLGNEVGEALRVRGKRNIKFRFQKIQIKGVRTNGTHPKRFSSAPRAEEKETLTLGWFDQSGIYAAILHVKIAASR